MGKIGDLWVRLGLKSEDFDKGIEKAKGSTEGFGGTVSKIKGIAVAAWAAIGAAAAKMALDFIQNSNKFGDEWDKTMARLKASWNTFTTALTSWNWDNFFGRMKSAADAAASLTATQDREMEVENSINLRKSAIAEELELLRIQAQNQKLSYAEREKAAKEYLDKVKGFYDDETLYRKQLMTDTATAWLAQGGIEATAENIAALEEFLKHLETDAEMMDMLAKRASDNAADYNEYLKWANSGEYWKRMAGANFDIYQNITGRDTTNQALVDAFTGYNYSRGAYQQENRRLFNAMNTAGAQVAGKEAGETAAKSFADGFDRILRERENKDDAIREFWNGQLNAVLEETETFNEELQGELDRMQGVINENLQKANLNEWAEEMSNAAVSLAETLSRELISAFDELAQAIASGEEIGGAQLAKALLTPIADMAVSLGTIVMMSGEAMEALKEAMSTLFGGGAVGAVAAGAALIGVGIAAKAGIAALASSGSASSSTSVSGAGQMATNYGASTAELTVYVKGEIKGNDILLSGNRAQAEWNK